MRDENCSCGETTVDPFCIVCNPSAPADCYYCGLPTSSTAGDPGMWPIYLSHSIDPGVMKSHHMGCVQDRLERFDRMLKVSGKEYNAQQLGCEHTFVPSSPRNQEEDQFSGVVCSKCEYHPQGWYCPDSADHLCTYEKDYDSCDFCGEPEERK